MSAPRNPDYESEFKALEEKIHELEVQWNVLREDSIKNHDRIIKIENQLKKLEKEKDDLLQLMQPAPPSTLEEDIHKKFVKPVLKEGKDTAVATAKVTLKTLEVLTTAGSILADIGKNIVQPIDLAISGAVGLWNVYKNFIDEHGPQRKTRMAVGALNAMAAIAGIGVVVLAASNPIGLAVCLLGTAAFGFYKRSYVTSQAKNEVKQCERAITEVKKELNDNKLKEPRDEKEIKLLETKEQRLNSELAIAKEKHFEKQRKNVFSGMMVVGCALLLGGVFFPPLAAAGAVILGGSAIIDAIDKKYDYKFTKGVANTIGKVTSKISTWWQEVKDKVRGKKETAEPSLDSKKEIEMSSMDANKLNNASHPSDPVPSTYKDLAGVFHFSDDSVKNVHDPVISRNQSEIPHHSEAPVQKPYPITSEEHENEYESSPPSFKK